MSDEKTDIHHEEGVEIAYDQIAPETLRRMIEEFVSRDGVDWAESDGSLEEKVRRVEQQLRSKKIRIVFDLTSETANLVVSP